MRYLLTSEVLEQYLEYLKAEEKTIATIQKYRRDILHFFRFLAERQGVTKELVIHYKQVLTEKYAAASTNSMLVALNGFFAYLGWDDLKVKILKVQQQCFRDKEKELTKEEYKRLVRAARQEENERMYVLLQTICATGIRVSEHRFITVEGLASGKVRILNKGKERVILIPKELQQLLKGYCRQNGIYTGSVFVTRRGKPLDRSNIWHEMKALCQTARVDPDKVFPHNLRHLFAVTYYQLEKDIVRLADILGHSSVETTRIYTYTSGVEHMRNLSRLRLLI